MSLNTEGSSTGNKQVHSLVYLCERALFFNEKALKSSLKENQDNLAPFKEAFLTLIDPDGESEIKRKWKVVPRDYSIEEVGPFYLWELTRELFITSKLPRRTERYLKAHPEEAKKQIRTALYEIYGLPNSHNMKQTTPLPLKKRFLIAIQGNYDVALKWLLQNKFLLLESKDQKFIFTQMQSIDPSSLPKMGVRMAYEKTWDAAKKYIISMVTKQGLALLSGVTESNSQKISPPPIQITFEGGGSSNMRHEKSALEIGLEINRLLGELLPKLPLASRL